MTQRSYWNKLQRLTKFWADLRLIVLKTDLIPVILFNENIFKHNPSKQNYPRYGICVKNSTAASSFILDYSELRKIK